MAAPRFSALLLDRRRQLGITLGRAARELRMKERVLQAFEEGDFSVIPGSGYAQGMLASYATYLGLDPRAVVDLFKEDREIYENGGVAPRRRRGEGGRGDRGRTAASARADRDAQMPVTRRRGTASPLVGSAGAPARYPQSGYGQAQGQPGYGRPQRIETRPVGPGYTDDRRYDPQVSPYEAASSAEGRRGSRNIASTQRPYGPRRRGPQSQSKQFPAIDFGNQKMVLLVGAAVVVVLTLLVVFTVQSCVGSMTKSKQSDTVPVSTAAEKPDDSSQQQKQDSSSAPAADQDKQPAKPADTTKPASAPTKTTVVVTVADNSVSWVEITVDGKSVVAESITGYWSKSFEPTESMTIQVGDTAAVTVTKNGENQSFDTKASGLGTITIKVPKPPEKKDGDKKDGEKADAPADPDAEKAVPENGQASSTTSTAALRLERTGNGATKTERA